MKIIRPVILGDTGSFTRATSGTYYDSTGTMQTAAANIPRFNFDPLNLNAGPTLLVEPAATNILLNSATLVTQSVTVVAGTYTLAFNGNGSVTLSGASTGVKAGGANRSVYTITTTAGSLTLTVAGAVTLAQLESGSKTTSYIATTTAAVTRAADVNTAMMVSNIPETDYAVYSTATTYASGTRVMVLATHKVYQSIQANNTNHPVTDLLWWVEVGMTNRWSMFDTSITSQSTQANNIYVAISPQARFDSIVGLNVAGARITVNIADPTSGIVFSKVMPLTSDSGVNDWHEYFYEPIVSATEFIIDGIPVAYSNATITVSVTATANVGVGGLIVGLSKTIGLTEAGAKVSIVDYSIKTRDPFGNYVITARTFSKRADFTVKVDSSTVDALQTLLATYRTVPVVYVGSNDTAKEKYAATIIYGFYKDFSIDITYPPDAMCSMQIEGLT